MAEIVDLRRVKKALAREAAAALAAENRARSGRTKAERAAEAKRQALLHATLDGAALSENQAAKRAKDRASST